MLYKAGMFVFYAKMAFIPCSSHILTEHLHIKTAKTLDFYIYNKVPIGDKDL